MGARSRLAAVAVATGAALAVASSAAPATAHGRHHRHHHGSAVEVVAQHLSDPYGLDRQGRGFVVAENGAGRVTHVEPDGTATPLLTQIGGVAGVASGWGTTFAVTGGPNEQGAPAPGNVDPSTVVRISRSGKVTSIADLLQYELDHNPDGQKQFDTSTTPPTPYDALSNPFSMNLSRYGLLVADGGANDVLRVDPWSGKVSTFFVPPTIDAPGCQQANPGTTGCDPVPTGIAVANGSVYVSTLGAEVPGAGRVYQLDPWSGKIRHVWSDLTAPTGIAVDRDGTIYVSEVLYNAPDLSNGPPAGFDPSTVGRITRIDCDGTVTHAAVTMPIGLVIEDGKLYSTAWSVASFLGLSDAGQIVRVRRSAFS